MAENFLTRSGAQRGFGPLPQYYEAMTTPWGDLEVLDAHAHFFSHRFFQTLHQQRPAPPAAQSVDEMVAALGWTPPPEDPARLARQWAAELDRHGVARSVLMASVPGDEDSAGAVVAADPGRFFGWFMLNPLAPDAEQRAARAFDELRLQGLCLFPAMLGFSVGDERLSPLYRLAAERPKTVVFVHMGVLTVGVRRRLGLPSRFDMTRSNPLDLHPVALANPETKFIVPHFGAGFFREALMLADLCPNVYFDTSSTNAWRKYLTPPPPLAEVFRQAIDVVGPERLLFGSDSSFFPRGWNRAVFDEQTAALAEVGVSPDDARKIFGGNLASLLA